MGVDLLDFFAGNRSWRQFYNFLDKLPYWGHYKTALVMDEQWARYVCDQEDAGEGVPGQASLDNSPAMTPLGYSDVISRLDLIADRVMGVRTAVQAGHSKDGKEPSFTPMRRPETALDSERERRTTDELHELDAMILGGGLPFNPAGAETE